MAKRMIIVSAAIAFIVLIGIPSFASQENYPQIEIGGRKNWFYSDYDVSPLKNYEIALEDALIHGSSVGPWTEEIRLYVAGDLLEEINVVYDLEQNSATMDRYNLKVNYRNYSLFLGDPGDYFNGQEYILQDHANGIGAAAKWDKFRAMLFSGAYPGGWLAGNYSDYKIYRNPQYSGNKGFSYFNNNPYLEYLSLDLKRADIKEDSVEVYLDGRKLIRKLDFHFDGAYGLVLISSTFKKAKEAKIIYVQNDGERKEAAFDFRKEARRRAFSSPDFRIIEGSEVITVDGVRRERDLDYRANYSLGLFIMNQPVHDDAEIRIDYDYTYGAGLPASETISGQTGTSFSLAHKFIIDKSERVVKNGQYLYSGTDYSMIYSNGTIIFDVPLVNSDTVEVSYSYKGIRQDVAGANVEYELLNWSRIGGSAVSISPSKSDEYLYDEISPSSFFIWNVYNRTVLNENTFINAELAASSQNVDFRNSNTIEADSALKVFGRTSFGDLELDGTYRKTGLNFASVRKVKSDTARGEENAGINAKYSFNKYFSVGSGIANAIRQEGASPEVNSTAVAYDIYYTPFEFWSIEGEIRRKTCGYNALPSFTGQELSTYLYSKWDLHYIFPLMNDISEGSNVVYKWLNMDTDTLTVRSELGWITDFKGGFSSYLLYTVENMRDDISASSYDRSKPYCKLSYLWDLGGGQNLEISYDYAMVQQRGSTDYDKNERGIGIVWNLPFENPVLSEFKISALSRSYDYTDLNDPLNNYLMSEMEIAGSLVF